MSELFVRTLREDPADAEVPSHRWLVRAGYIRRAAPGIYSWLPLGFKVLRKVEEIVREEMAAIGAQEVHFPALLPREPYEATGRWTEYGPNIFRLKDRKDADYLLGPTHEEMFTLLVKDLYSSYKDLPLSLFQIQTKYRDEARPRAGILRGREFVMKDSYSFDIDEAGQQKSYDLHRDAYIKIFDRLGFEYAIVQAMSGAMGGSASEEFLAIAENGEDTFVRSPGGYAANVEAVHTAVPDPIPFDDAPGAHVEDTPDTPTIETLVAVANERFPRDDRPWQAGDTLKNVVFMVTEPDGKRAPLVVGVPGDREVDLKRLAAQLEPAEAEVFSADDFAAHPGLVKGYIGPQSLGVESATGVRYLVDPRVVAGTRWLTGANQPGRHVFDLVAGRDFTPDGTIEAAEIRAGDPAAGRLGPAAAGARHRDGSYLPARQEVRRGARPEGAGSERQAGHGHHGFVRDRGIPRGRRGGRRDLRREGAQLAAADRAVRRPSRGGRQGRGRARVGRRSRPEAGRGRCRGAAGRPQGEPGREVRRCRDHGNADDRGGRPVPGRWTDRGPRPGDR